MRWHKSLVSCRFLISKMRKMLRLRLKNIIHQLFLILAILLAALGVVYKFWAEATTLDINVHDTYFVIAYFYLYAMGAMWLLFCGLLYWIAKREQIPLFFLGVLFHFLCTVVGLLSWVFPFDIASELWSIPYREQFFWTTFYTLSSLLFIFAQILFLLFFSIRVGVKIFKRPT